MFRDDGQVHGDADRQTGAPIEHAQGSNTTAGPPPHAPTVPPTTANAWHTEDFIAWLKLHFSQHTAHAYGQAIKRFTFFAAGRGAAVPDAVDPRIVEDFTSQLRAEGDSPRTVNHRLAAVKSFFRWLRKNGHAWNDPAGDVNRMRVPRRLPRYLSIADQNKLTSALAATSGDTARRDEAVIVTALLSGLRVAELAALRVDEVDLDGATLRVVNGKGSKDRELPIVPKLARILRAYLKVRTRLLKGHDSPWLFVSARAVNAAKRRGRCPRPPGEPLGRHAIFLVVKHACQAHLGRDASPHVMRHSFATHLRERGADLQLIQECLGHASIMTTTIYAHLATDRRRQLMAKLLSK